MSTLSYICLHKANAYAHRSSRSVRGGPGKECELDKEPVLKGPTTPGELQLPAKH